jgi:hypothetical protein
MGQEIIPCVQIGAMKEWGAEQVIDTNDNDPVVSQESTEGMLLLRRSS